MNRPSPWGGEGLRDHKQNRTTSAADYTRRLESAPSTAPGPGDVQIQIIGPHGLIIAGQFPWSEARMAVEHLAEGLPSAQRQMNAVIIALMVEILVDDVDDDRGLYVLMSALGAWWGLRDSGQCAERRQHVNRLFRTTGVSKLVFDVGLRDERIAIASRFEPVRTARAA